MTTDILNLPKWDILEVEEGHAEYIIKARYTVQPSACPSCGVMFPRLHRYGTKQQPYRDLPIHGKKVRLLVVKKRWKCLECGNVWLETLDDLDDHHRATKRLVQWVQEKALERTFTSLGEEIGVDEGTIRHIFNRHLAALDESVVFQTPRYLGIDELHLLGKARGVLTNLEARTIIDILEGRKGTTVAKRLMAFPDRDKIELVAIDMWAPYRDAVKGVLPQAVIVIDKFHVLRMATAAVDKVRKGIRERLTDRQRRTLMHDRFLLFRRKRDLEPDKALLLETWLLEFDELRAAYDLKEQLYDLWDGIYTSTTARNQYQAWLEKATASGVLWAFNDLVTAVDNWGTEIFAYFDHRITNATTEALNGLTRVVNRMGRGYSFRAIRAKMLYSARNRKTPKPQEEPVQDKIMIRFTYSEVGIDIDNIKWLALDFNSVKDSAKSGQPGPDSTFRQRLGRLGRRRDSTHNSE